MQKEKVFINLDGVLRNEQNRPIKGAVEGFENLAKVFDAYIVAIPDWNKLEDWNSSKLWVDKYLRDSVFKRLILTHHKEHFQGRAFIDCNLENGTSNFQGEIILFGSVQFPIWDSILNHLLANPATLFSAFTSQPKDKLNNSNKCINCQNLISWRGFCSKKCANNFETAPWKTPPTESSFATVRGEFYSPQYLDSIEWSKKVDNIFGSPTKISPKKENFSQFSLKNHGFDLDGNKYWK